MSFLVTEVLALELAVLKITLSALLQAWLLEALPYRERNLGSPAGCRLGCGRGITKLSLQDLY